MSVSIEEIRAMFRAENALMLDAALQKMEGAIDARMTGYENRISKEVSDLQKRTEQLELREKARAEGNNPAVQEVKRRRRSLSVETGSDGVGSNACSFASSRRHDDEEQHTVVFSGFPAKSRRKLLIDFVKLQLPVVERFAGIADIFDLEDKVFAPGIRTSVAMIRLLSKTALFKFVNAWKQAEEAGFISKFGDEGLVIRAKRDKPPAIRKAHGKLWQLFTHLRSLGHNDAEIDWRNCTLWINDCEVVKWDVDNELAIWRETDMTLHNLLIDIAAANLVLTQAQNP